MRALAERLSVDFDHVRIDLYLIEDRSYFGEMTFIDGGGRTDYSTVGGVRNDLDFELGRIWHYGQNFPAAQTENAAVLNSPPPSAVSS